MGNKLSFLANSCLFTVFLFFYSHTISAQNIWKQNEGVSSKVAGKSIDKGVVAIDSPLEKTRGEVSDSQHTMGIQEKALTDTREDVHSFVKLSGIHAVEQNDTTAPQFGVYTKFTFIPGNKLLFYDDFAQEQIGDFPTNWETGGTGEIVRLPGNDQTWFSLMRRSGYLPNMKYPLPESYTIEFDMMTSGFKQGDPGYFRFVFANKKAYSASNLGSKVAMVKFALNHATSTTRAKQIDISNGNSSADIRTSIGYDYSSIIEGVTHFSISVSKQRLQVWLNEEKVVDAPSLLKNDYGRYFLIEAHDVLKEKDQYLVITNFRIAAAPENQRRLFDNTNIFSTTGIYFNTNSAVVKKESYGILKMIAEAIQAEAGSSFEILGHTDSDGADNFNKQLSERRALAVKNILVSQFGIADTKLTTSGKGETQPVDDNKTLQGKANNRRVEIIKK